MRYRHVRRFDPAHQGPIERRDLQGLAQQIAHAGRHRPALHIGLATGGHGNDRQPPQVRIPANLAGRGEAVHDRHLTIHQHSVKAPLLKQQTQGLRTVRRQHHLDSHALQQALQHFLVEPVVLDHQHPRPRQPAYRVIDRALPRCGASRRRGRRGAVFLKR